MNLEKEARSAGEERNQHGQWVKGVSGNPTGRPRKKVAQASVLADRLAQALSEATRELTEAVPSMSPAQLIATTKLLLSIRGAELAQEAENAGDSVYVQQSAREKILARLNQIRERHGEADRGAAPDASVPE